MKWETSMAASGLTEQTVSNSVRKKIANYREFTETLIEQKQNLKKGDLDEKQKKKVETNIDTLEKSIVNLDAVLVKDMARLHKNGDRYKQMSSRLPNRKGLKKPATETTAPETKPAEVPAATPPAAAETPAAPAATTTKATTAAPAATKKIETPPSPNPPKDKTKTAGDQKTKSNGWGIALGITVFVLTLGTIGYVKFIKGKK